MTEYSKKRVAKLVPRSPLELSLNSLLFLGSFCCLLAVLTAVQISLRRPEPGSAFLRAIIIPEAQALLDIDSSSYRFLVSQIVQRSSSKNFFEGRDISDLIIRVSTEENIDPLLVAAIIKAESTFATSAVSNKGAMGLMQVRAGTAQYVSKMIGQIIDHIKDFQSFFSVKHRCIWCSRNSGVICVVLGPIIGIHQVGFFERFHGNAS